MQFHPFFVLCNIPSDNVMQVKSFELTVMTKRFTSLWSICRQMLGIWCGNLRWVQIFTSLSGSIISALRYPRSKLYSRGPWNWSMVSCYECVIFFFSSYTSFFFVYSKYACIIASQAWNSVFLHQIMQKAVHNECNYYIPIVPFTDSKYEVTWILKKKSCCRW
jgi:hypothetical protein